MTEDGNQPTSSSDLEQRAHDLIRLGRIDECAKVLERLEDLDIWPGLPHLSCVHLFDRMLQRASARPPEESWWDLAALSGTLAIERLTRRAREWWAAREVLVSLAGVRAASVLAFGERLAGAIRRWAHDAKHGELFPDRFPWEAWHALVWLRVSTPAAPVARHFARVVRYYAECLALPERLPALDLVAEDLCLMAQALPDDAELVALLAKVLGSLFAHGVRAHDEDLVRRHLAAVERLGTLAGETTAAGREPLEGPDEMATRGPGLVHALVRWARTCIREPTCPGPEFDRALAPAGYSAAIRLPAGHAAKQPPDPRAPFTQEEKAIILGELARGPAPCCTGRSARPRVSWGLPVVLDRQALSPRQQAALAAVERRLAAARSLRDSRLGLPPAPSTLTEELSVGIETILDRAQPAPVQRAAAALFGRLAAAITPSDRGELPRMVARAFPDRRLSPGLAVIVQDALAWRPAAEGTPAWKVERDAQAYTIVEGPPLPGAERGFATAPGEDSRAALERRLDIVEAGSKDASASEAFGRVVGTVRDVLEVLRNATDPGLAWRLDAMLRSVSTTEIPEAEVRSRTEITAMWIHELASGGGSSAALRILQQALEDVDCEDRARRGTGPGVPGAWHAAARVERFVDAGESESARAAWTDLIRLAESHPCGEVLDCIGRASEALVPLIGRDRPLARDLERGRPAGPGSSGGGPATRLARGLRAGDEHGKAHALLREDGPARRATGRRTRGLADGRGPAARAPGRGVASLAATQRGAPPARRHRSGPGPAREGRRAPAERGREDPGAAPRTADRREP
ncbi:MAG: hypothetical protein HY815_03245 [Candidatus Riflebacteria bacterium]|nr:hypothetical protein [Candidatus Riflebacteria bacterium]